MPGKKIIPTSLEHWRKHAQSDLKLAMIDEPGILYESRCFHAQQAVEKSLKAILIISGIEISKTHKIDELIRKLPKDILIPPFLSSAEILTTYAVTTRYPGDRYEVTREDWKKALDLAGQVLKWAEEVIDYIINKG